MKKLVLAASLLALAIPSIGFAQEEEEASRSWSASLGFLSDYRFRGISQTQEDPAVQFTGSLSFDSGFYIGTFISNVDFVPGDGANFELDGVLGYNVDVNEWLNLDASLTQYAYPSSDVDYSYAEFIGKATVDNGSGLSGSFMIGYSGDVFATSEDGIYYGLGGNVSIAESYTVSATVGYYDLDDAYGSSITDYSIGVSKAIGDSLTVGFQYVDTNGGLEDVYGEINDGRVVFSVGVAF